MHQQISKKIIIYLFIFTTLVTVNNSNLLSFNLLQISKLDISGKLNIKKLILFTVTSIVKRNK